jgi:predicted GNAT family N-acyltransferase
MPNAPKKPATSKKSPAVKPKAAKKPPAAGAEVVETALKRCTAHLKHLDTKVALEVIAQLKEYYLKHGLKVPNGSGFKLS